MYGEGVISKARSKYAFYRGQIGVIPKEATKKTGRCFRERKKNVIL